MSVRKCERVKITNKSGVGEHMLLGKKCMLPKKALRKQLGNGGPNMGVTVEHGTETNTCLLSMREGIEQSNKDV